MTRLRPTAATLAALTTWFLAAPAFAEVGPPLAPAPSAPAPSVLDFAVDALLPGVVSYLALGYVVKASAPGVGLDPVVPAPAYLTTAALAVGLAAPPAALVAYRERPFAVDMLLASFAGGMVGLGAGYGAARLAGGGVPAPELLALSMAVGQGLATASAYHLYRVHKVTAKDLDRLPVERTDDPIDDWKLWRERRTP